jgi:hypothetical protein
VLRRAAADLPEVEVVAVHGREGAGAVERHEPAASALGSQGHQARAALRVPQRVHEVLLAVGLGMGVLPRRVVQPVNRIDPRQRQPCGHPQPS